MKTIALVTGNAGKLKEWQRLFPAQVKLEAINLDLDEIQSLDLDAIALDKARRAYAAISKPVLVEDVSAGLGKLHGLPGPFIKYFEIAMGADALFQLAGAAGEPAIVTAVIAYYDGAVSLTARADVSGTVVPARGNNGFGFDACFMPGGQTSQPKTYAEMSAAEKDAVSHRRKALQIMIRQLGLDTGA